MTQSLVSVTTVMLIAWNMIRIRGLLHSKALKATTDLALRGFFFISTQNLQSGQCSRNVTFPFRSCLLLSPAYLSTFSEAHGLSWYGSGAFEHSFTYFRLEWYENTICRQVKINTAVRTFNIFDQLCGWINVCTANGLAKRIVSRLGRYH